MSNETGVFQLKDGSLGFRYTLSLDGKRNDVKRVRDASGNPMQTKRAAMIARADALKVKPNHNQEGLFAKLSKKYSQSSAKPADRTGLIRQNGSRTAYGRTIFPRGSENDL